jgi:hypothetical protein
VKALADAPTCAITRTCHGISRVGFQSSVAPLTSGLRRLGMIAAVSLRLLYLIFLRVLGLVVLLRSTASSTRTGGLGALQGQVRRSGEHGACTPGWATVRRGQPGCRVEGRAPAEHNPPSGRFVISFFKLQRRNEQSAGVPDGPEETTAAT